MTRSSIALLLVAGTALAGSAAGQTTFKSGVEAVRLDVSVTRAGRPVAGLSATDFDVTDAGVPQLVDSASVDSQPVSVFLVLDTSGSTAGYVLGHLIEAAQTLVAALRPADRAALITFSTDVTVRVPLTHDLPSVASALASLTGSGATSLRDAVFTAQQLRPEDETRPVVLVFTDGCDSSSWLSAPDVLAATRRTDVVVHVIELADARPQLDQLGRVCPGVSPRARNQSTFLDDLVSAAGGRAWSSTSSSELRSLFTRALDEMRARYLVTFSPQGVPREGWHDLKVRLKSGRADITTRRGYFVPPRE